MGQFTRDKLCTFFFTPGEFSVKDLRTGKQIARGNREGDLYVLRQHGDALMALTASAEPSIRATDFIWHSRLGHPRTLQFLRSSDAIYFSGKPSTSRICSSCQVGKLRIFKALKASLMAFETVFLF